MSSSLIIIVGWLVGQFGYAAVSVKFIQRKVTGIKYWIAWREYSRAEIGSFVIAFAGLLILLFIAPDFLNTSVSKADLLQKEKITLLDKIVIYQRVAAVILGIFSQHLLSLLVGGGKKAIHDYAAKNNIDGNA